MRVQKKNAPLERHHFPQFYRAVLGGTNQEPAVRRPRYVVHRAHVPVEGRQKRPRAAVPHFDLLVEGSAREAPTVRAKG